MASFTLSTLPMFILMAHFLTPGRFTRDMFGASYRRMGHLRGGIAYAAIAGGVMLSAISGSSTAAAGTLSSAAYPEMDRYGHAKSFSTATLAVVVGTLTIMIPPSLGLILYGVFTETSLGALLMAGILPGVVTALGYVLAINLIVRRNPAVAPRSGTRAPLPRATRNSAMILAIIFCASVFGIFLTMTGVAQNLLRAIQTADIHPYLVLALVIPLLLIPGFFLDQLAVLVLTMPMTFPLLTGFGFDPVWFGVVFVKTSEIGLVSPPMGLNCFAVSSTTGCRCAGCSVASGPSC